MKNSKKILIVTSEFPPQPGGIGNHAYNLALQLQNNRYEVGVLVDERSNNGLKEKQFDKTLPFKVFRISSYKLRFITYLMRLVVYKTIVNGYSKVIASGKFSLWMVGLDPFLSKNKKIAIVHGSELNLKGFSKIGIEKALLKFNKIVAVSNYTKSLINSLALNNIQVIPNGFTISNFKSKKGQGEVHKNNSPVLITVGSVSERKGQLNVIKTLPMLLKIFPQIHYHIVGIPSEQIAFEKVALELGVTKHITFHGQVNEAKKNQLLTESDIFMMLSHQTNSGDVEGFGIAILEANALGLPAIGSKNCGIEDAISHQKSGLLVLPTEVEEVCNAVQLIWRNIEDYQKNTLDWSVNFKWEKVIQKYIALIDL